MKWSIIYCSEEKRFRSFSLFTFINGNQQTLMKLTANKEISLPYAPTLMSKLESNIVTPWDLCFTLKLRLVSRKTLGRLYKSLNTVQLTSEFWIISLNFFVPHVGLFRISQSRLYFFVTNSGNLARLPMVTHRKQRSHSK